MKRPFLTAQWRYLAMLNYEVDPAILAPLVPKGTLLDDEHPAEAVPRPPKTWLGADPESEKLGKSLRAPSP